LFLADPGAALLSVGYILKKKTENKDLFHIWHGSTYSGRKIKHGLAVRPVSLPPFWFDAFRRDIGNKKQSLEGVDEDEVDVMLNPEGRARYGLSRAVVYVVVL
jgi:hypothetical protein